MQNRKVQVISSKVLYIGKWVKLRKDEIVKPDGTRATHELAERDDSVIIIASQNDKFPMVRMYRYPVDDKSWELPMGFINKNETPEKAAIRELHEETGLIAKNVKLIGFFWGSPGFLTQKTYVFFASSFSIGKTSFDKTEKDIEIKFMTKKQLHTLIRENRIRSGATLAAFSLLNSTNNITF